MPELEILNSNPLKSVGKNKKVLLFAGVGVAAGLVVLAMRGLRGGSSEEVLVSGGEETTDQSVSVLGSQLQAFEAALVSSQNAIAAQLETSQNQYELLEESFLEYQRKAQEDNESLVAELLELQNQKPQVITQYVTMPETPTTSGTRSNKLVTSSDGTYTGYSSEGYTPVRGVTPDPVLNTRGEYMFTNVSSEARDAFIAVNGRGPGLGSGSSGSSSKSSGSSSSSKSSGSGSSGQTIKYSNDGTRYSTYDSSGKNTGSYDSATGKRLN